MLRKLIITTALFGAFNAFGQQRMDLQAHRGGRGLMPENSIPAMLSAVRMGIRTLEMDLVISKDGKVVVSHDTYMSADFMRKPDGTEITKEEQKTLLIYGMNYDLVKSYDGGTKPHSQFPDQKKLKTYKPLFSELIDSVNAYVKKNKLKPVYFSVEIKSSPDGDGTAHPVPAIFVQKVMELINKKNIGSRTIIQSFDLRPLQILRASYPAQKLSFLIANKDSFEVNIKNLGFEPYALSPYFSLVTAELVNEAHQKNIKVIPWTVNTVEEMKKMESFSVDGIISDFPNLLISQFGSYQK